MAERTFVIVADDEDRESEPGSPFTVNVYADSAAGELVSCGFGATILDAIHEAFDPHVGNLDPDLLTLDGATGLDSSDADDPDADGSDPFTPPDGSDNYDREV